MTLFVYMCLIFFAIRGKVNHVFDSVGSLLPLKSSCRKNSTNSWSLVEFLVKVLQTIWMQREKDTKKTKLKKNLFFV